MNPSLNDFIAHSQSRIEKMLADYLQNKSAPALSLQEAINYTVMNGGKRIRPLLVYASGRALNASWDNLDAPALAVELIHTYSLIHDDLPAMDNADLRRGKPSCHKAYNEALAILAGDALQPLAFEIIASHSSPLSPTQRLAMIQALAKASGLHGMVAGQALDIEGISDLASLTQMVALKTGALISACVKLGMMASHPYDLSITQHLEKFSNLLGVAFQMQDDLLDRESTSSISGKPQGLDADNQKNTFPTLLGLEKTRLEIDTLFTKAMNTLTPLGDQAGHLAAITLSLLHRKK